MLRPMGALGTILLMLLIFAGLAIFAVAKTLLIFGPLWWGVFKTFDWLERDGDDPVVGSDR